MATKKAKRWQDDKKFVEWLKTMGYANEDDKLTCSDGIALYMWEAWRGALGEDTGGPAAKKARQRRIKKKNDESKKEGRRVLVTGGQTYDNEAKLNAVLSLLHRKGGISTLIVGPADGADAMSCAWAEERDIPVELVKEKGPSGNAARLAKEPDIVVAFPGGGGRTNMVKLARDADVKVIEVAD